MDAEHTGQPSESRVPVDETITAAVMDRVLLYLRGMDISPVRALELALATARRLETGSTGSTAVSLPQAMQELHALLRENRLHTGWVDRDAPPRGSMPPLNRCSMIAEGLEGLFPPRFQRRGRCA